MHKLRVRLFKLGNYIAWILPTSIARPVMLPFIYQTRVADGFIYENANMLNVAFGYCYNNKITGDYAEFGVFRGRTTVEAWRAAYRHGLLANTTFWLFDSFEGLPEVVGIDDEGKFETGEFFCSLDEFKENLRKRKVDFNRINIVQGYFGKTLPETQTKKNFSVVWIDCDLYESTIPVLEWLTDKVVDGGVICFDDWYCFNGRPDKGEQRAVNEWLEANPQISLMPYREFHWAGKSFIFHRNDRDE